MARFLYILLVIVLFGVLIAIHEFGHFITAKLLGVKVNEFAIGMGPALWTKQKGETLYALRAFPVGGYCAMEGEDEDTGDPRAFSRQKGWKKIIILCAGSFMNFLLGLIIVAALALGSSQIAVPVVTELLDGFQHQGEAGLMVGDQIVSVDGNPVLVNGDAAFFLRRNDGNGMDLVVERQGRRVELNGLDMKRFEYTYAGQTSTGFGIILGEMRDASIPQRLASGFAETIDYVRIVWISLGDLVTGRVAVSELSGVIGVVDVVSEMGTQYQTEAQSALAGVLGVLSMMALIAVNLAVMNLLPIPALDGGRIFFVLLNGILFAVAKRRIPEKYEGYVHAGAFVVLLALMALVALHDVWNIFA